MYQSLVWLADYLQFTVISFICKEIYEEAGGGGKSVVYVLGKALCLRRANMEG